MVEVLIGCGTVKTINQSDSLIASDLGRFKSNCHSMPRVYSGVGYDVCILNSATVDYAQQLSMWFYIFDTIPSAIADTVVLPYTGVMQHKNGNLSLKSQKH
jgi:uncharacterized protein YceK